MALNPDNSKLVVVVSEDTDDKTRTVTQVINTSDASVTGNNVYYSHDDFTELTSSGLLMTSSGLVYMVFTYHESTGVYPEWQRIACFDTVNNNQKFYKGSTENHGKSVAIATADIS